MSPSRSGPERPQQTPGPTLSIFQWPPTGHSPSIVYVCLVRWHTAIFLLLLVVDVHHVCRPHAPTCEVVQSPSCGSNPLLLTRGCAGRIWAHALVLRGSDPCRALQYVCALCERLVAGAGRSARCITNHNTCLFTDFEPGREICSTAAACTTVLLLLQHQGIPHGRSLQHNLPREVEALFRPSIHPTIYCNSAGSLKKKI